jgi:hypothetical protein
MASINLSQYPLIKISDNDTKMERQLKKSFFVSNQTNEFLVPKSDKNIPLLRHTTNKNVHLLEILFHGLNLSAKRIRFRRPAFYVDVHKSEVFVCHQKVRSNYKSRLFKRRLLFFSFNPSVLHRIKKIVQAFKMPNVYTGKGLFDRTQDYHVKKGKEYRK